MCINPLPLAYVPDHLITQEMCNEIMRTVPNAFHRIPDRFKAQEMCIKAVEVDQWYLYDVPDHFKTQEMCDKAVRDYLFSLQFVPDWFVTQQMMTIMFAMIMRWLSDTKVIKNVRPRKHKLKKSYYLLPGIPIVWWIGACQKTRRGGGSNR